MERGEEFHWEQQRTRRVREILAEAKRQLPARQIEIRAPAEARFQTISSLPSAIQLAPGELHIQFSEPQELLTYLFQLAQGLTNDFESFENVINRKS